MDMLKPFLEECCVVGEEYKTPSAEIYTAYVQWCQRNNVKTPLTQRILISHLKERGFFPYHSRSERGLKGLKPYPIIRNGIVTDEFMAHRD
jgi:phage/plasmid-associated DNA primase